MESQTASRLEVLPRSDSGWVLLTLHVMAAKDGNGRWWRYHEIFIEHLWSIYEIGKGMYIVYRFMPMYAKHATCWLLKGGLLEINLKIYSSHHFHGAGTAKIWSFGMEHSPLGTQTTWSDDIRGCRWCPRMSMSKHVAKWTNASQWNTSESWGHGKGRLAKCSADCRGVVTTVFDFGI